MIINLCPTDGQSAPYFKDITPADTCAPLPDTGEWQFEHYALPPVKTYKDPKALVQARLRGEFSIPHISAFKPTTCTIGPACGELAIAVDLGVDPRNDLITVNDEDKLDHANHIICQNAKIEAHNQPGEPLIKMVEPIPTFHSIELDKDCLPIVGVIRPMEILSKEGLI